MTARDHVPAGAATWADLWTSDVEGSRRFYSEVLGWEAQEASAEFGGYFMFTCNGAPVAGCMGDMPDMTPDNTWKIYFDTSDIAHVATAAASHGGDVRVPPLAIADLGSQTVCADPGGAVFGGWQTDTFSGFAELDVPGAPSWFELHTRDHPRAVAFYHEVLGWDVDFVSDTDDFRYAMVRHPEGEMGMAGMMDSRADIAEGQPDFWKIYWHTADMDATIASAVALGATVLHPAEHTPYGVLAVLADPAGAEFSLRTPPS